MKTIENYFNAERNESVLFFLAGLTAIFLWFYLVFKLRESFYTGLAYALLLVAVIQVTVGASVFFRSPKDIVRVKNILINEREKIVSEEIPRMEVVMKNFVIYRYVEIALVVIGLMMFFFISDRPVLKGAGLGLMAQAGLMLVLDFFAESRGKVYMDFLKNL